MKKLILGSIVTALALPLLSLRNYSSGQTPCAGTELTGLCSRTYLQPTADDIFTQITHTTPWTARAPTVLTLPILDRCPNTAESPVCQVSTKVIGEGPTGGGNIGYFALRFYERDNQTLKHHVSGCPAVADEDSITVVLKIGGSAEHATAGSNNDYSLFYRFGTENATSVLVDGNDRVTIVCPRGAYNATNGGNTCNEPYTPLGVTLQIVTREDDDAGVAYEDVTVTVEQVYYDGDPNNDLTHQIGWNHKARWIIEEEP